MTIENIIEICVAIDVAIFGIAYPIIVDKISNIGEKYNSEYISVLFNNDFPQKALKKKICHRQFEISIFKLTLFTTILTFSFLIFNFEPLFGWDNIIINNSAKLLVFSSSTFLAVFFFIWLDKVSIYNGKSTSLLKYIISKYNELDDNSEIKAYYLKSINELTFYAINKQDEHLQKTLLEFYYQEFSKIRKNHDKSKPLIYPIDLYFLVNNLNTELINSENRKLLAIEHRAVSGIWLLGEDFESITISEETYSWLWRNLYTICDNDKFVKMYWANANQYLDFRLQYIPADYNFEERKIVNESEIKKRDEERETFLELHYALGGLILYRKKYETLKYLFEYSQSLPPKYVLLPETMTTIFKWFENFSNEFKNRKTPIDLKYYFPELDNLGNRRQVNYWICSYISVLFIRQYSLNTRYPFQNFISLPKLSEDIIELNNWLDTMSFFEKCLNDTLENKELIKSLDFEKIVIENKAIFEKFIQDLKESISAKIGKQKLEAALSDEKIKVFEENTNRIIVDAFSKYNSIYNIEQHTEIDDRLKLTINGGVTLLPKSAFTDGDIQHMFYDTVFAEQIAEYNIQKFIPNSFLVSKTKRYLLNKDNIINGLEKLIGNNQNIIIIGVNIRHDLNEIITKSKFANILVKIPSYESNVEDVLFVLNKIDLPYIEHKEIQEKEIERFKLNKINEELNLYSSIIDLNTPENKDLKDEWKLDKENNNLDLKVQVSIVFLAIIYWKKQRDIIQINFASQYKEQGIQSELSEIEILRNDTKQKLADNT
ncbi:hypothetical protein BWK59_00540 [Flavobacterium davisii]|uniref:Uncharacterized protein n=1 Tax=Flavobacterium davisii TaxID=2906077 RepID=A0A246GM28_9FLAO|nr:hypothetical protein [Flavobacterium davisii]OWP85374.1 hypothetical protein BWK59_00540 [Flavobacterium davisii]